MALRDDFNNIVSKVNDLGFQIEVYGADWMILPQGVKDAIKARAVATLTEAKDTDIPLIIAQIQAL